MYLLLAHMLAPFLEQYGAAGNIVVVAMLCLVTGSRRREQCNGGGSGGTLEHEACVIFQYHWIQVLAGLARNILVLCAALLLACHERA